MPILGVLFALGALVGWGFGEFFIQKTTRTIGNISALFFIGAVGGIVLLPFVWSELRTVSLVQDQWLLLMVAAVIAFIATIFNIEALRQGKIAVVEPTLGLEMPITVGFGILFVGEHITGMQLGVMLAIFIGSMLTVSSGSWRVNVQHRIEKGVLMAGLGAVGMAVNNVFIGLSSQQTSPLLAIWFIHSLLAVFCAVYLLLTRRLGGLVTDLRQYPGVIAGEAVFSNIAWVCYAFATIYIPISLAITISESYIALAALLGIIFNRERLRPHQIIGIIVAITGVIMLSSLVST